WLCKFKGIRISFFGIGIDYRTGGIGEVEHLSAFVKSFSYRIIQGFSDHFHLKIIGYFDDLSVSPADGQPQKRKVRTVKSGLVDKMCEQVCLHMVHFYQWYLKSKRQRFCKRCPDQ